MSPVVFLATGQTAGVVSWQPAGLCWCEAQAEALPEGELWSAGLSCGVRGCARRLFSSQPSFGRVRRQSRPGLKGRSCPVVDLQFSLLSACHLYFVICARAGAMTLDIYADLCSCFSPVLLQVRGLGSLRTTGCSRSVALQGESSFANVRLWQDFWFFFSA